MQAFSLPTPKAIRFWRSLCASVILPLLILMTSSYAHAEQIPIPKLNKRITDLTQTLTPEQIETLSRQLEALEKSKGSQIAVLLIPTTGDESIEQFSIRVVDEWKLGRQGVADGVLLLIAKNDKRVRIEVGRGLEGALPDITAGRIIREFIRPLFKQNDFNGGITIGIEKISTVIEGETLPEPVPNKGKNGQSDHFGLGDNLFGLHPMMWLGLLIGGLILSKILGPWLGRGGIGIGSAAAAFFAGTPIVIAVILGLGMTALLSIIASRFFWDIAGAVLQSGAIGGLGGGHGGSSNDSFSGGGGDFGGGGASGDW